MNNESKETTVLVFKHTLFDEIEVTMIGDEPYFTGSQVAIASRGLL